MKKPTFTPICAPIPLYDGDFLSCYLDDTLRIYTFRNGVRTLSYEIYIDGKPLARGDDFDPGNLFEPTDAFVMAKLVDEKLFDAAADLNVPHLQDKINGTIRSARKYIDGQPSVCEFADSFRTADEIKNKFHHHSFRSMVVDTYRMYSTLHAIARPKGKGYRLTIMSSQSSELDGSTIGCLGRFTYDDADQINNDLYWAWMVAGTIYGGALKSKKEWYECRISEEKNRANEALHKLGEYESDMPNGISSYTETFYEVAVYIESNFVNGSGVAGRTEDSAGRRELSHLWTREFEQKNKGREWDGEWLEELGVFCDDKNFGSRDVDVDTGDDSEAPYLRGHEPES